MAAKLTVRLNAPVALATALALPASGTLCDMPAVALATLRAAAARVTPWLRSAVAVDWAVAVAARLAPAPPARTIEPASDLTLMICHGLRLKS